MPHSNLTLLDPADALALARGALLRWGASPHVADCVAAHVVEAELAGHPSHGLMRLLEYRELATAGQCRLDAEPEVAEVRPGIASVEGGRGLGHPALAVAVDWAAARALELGVGACGVVQSGHAGRAGAWVERGVAQGCVTIVALGGSDPPFRMAARAGAAASLHTNPLAIGVPGNGAPLMLDMATSVVAEGKLSVAAARGEPAPPGVLVDADGRPSTDPRDLEAGGSLLPAGGHKGFGLSAMIEALAIGLTGADAPELHPVDGALVVCLRADSFRPEADLRSSVERLRERLRASGRDEPVLCPGDPEAAARRTAAVSIDDELLSALTDERTPE